jgi:hypothetical protein
VAEFGVIEGTNCRLTASSRRAGQHGLEFLDEEGDIAALAEQRRGTRVSATSTK